MTEHISRKELKQDKIKETFEHGAEAVYSHSKLATVLVLAVLLIACVYGGWKLYTDRQTAKAQVEFDAAMKSLQRAHRRHAGARRGPQRSDLSE